MHEFLFLALLSWALVLIAVILMSGAYRKFLDGKLKSLLGWILAAFWFMALPYTSFILRDADLLNSYVEEISYFIYFCMIVVSLCLTKGALELVEFSNVYGFADVKKRFENQQTQKGKKRKKKGG